MSAPDPKFSSAIHAAILSRRTVHAYRPEPVHPEIIQRALVAAHHAPCHKHTYPWRFSLAGPQARTALATLAVELKAAKRPLSPDEVKNVQSKMLNPAVLIVVGQVRHPDPFRSREDYAACSCAIQNLSLSLPADHIASKWSTGAITRHPSTHQILGIDPAEQEIIGFIWAGHPERVPTVQRPPLEAVVRQTP